MQNHQHSLRNNYTQVYTLHVVADSTHELNSKGVCYNRGEKIRHRWLEEHAKHQHTPISSSMCPCIAVITACSCGFFLLNYA